MPRRRKGPLKLKIRKETLYSVLAVFLIGAGLMVIVSFAGHGAWLLSLNVFLRQQLGFATLLIPFILIAAGLLLLRLPWTWTRPNVLLGSLLLLIGVMGFFQTGLIGNSIFINLSELLSSPGAYILFTVLGLSGALVMTQLSVMEAFDALISLKPKGFGRGKSDDKAEGVAGGLRLPKLSLPFGKAGPQFSINQGSDLDQGDSDDSALAVAGSKSSPADKSSGQTRDQAQGANQSKESKGASQDDVMSGALLSPPVSQLVWEYPPLSLLSQSPGGEADRGDVEANAAVIESTLESFGISAQVAEVNYGPSVTQYALKIAQGTKLSKITGLSTDLALALAAPTGQIRIEAPIAGRSLVGVEVPNHSAQFVTLRKMLASEAMKKHDSKLATALGINVSGQPVVMDIARMPHLLIAGATGSGKSVSVNALICSILFRASPAEVKFILVDPKRVELTAYNDIPHLLVPVIIEPKKVVSALIWATREMEKRYKQLAEVGVKNIDDYNELAGHSAMPSIVIVIDELADIMLYSPAEVEENITRIAQMARAVGIHLVLATQRPSVDVLTGLIKANIPARIAFNVSSMTDSRVILDSQGAEKLLGRGDMLFVLPDQAKPSRIQGTFVSDREIKKLIEFIKDQGQRPDYEEDITTKYKTASTPTAVVGPDGEERDELFDDVAQFVLQSDKGSSSSIQRHFSVGYNRAARILDQLEAAGMVGPQEGSKPREVRTSVILEYLRSKGLSNQV